MIRVSFHDSVGGNTIEMICSKIEIGVSIEKGKEVYHPHFFDRWGESVNPPTGANEIEIVPIKPIFKAVPPKEK